MKYLLQKYEKIITKSSRKSFYAKINLRRIRQLLEIEVIKILRHRLKKEEAFIRPFSKTIRFQY